MRVDWTSIPVTPGMRPGATRQGIAGRFLSAVRVSTQPGASFEHSAIHRHDNEQYLVMIAGSLQLEVEGETYWVHAGDLAVFNSDQAHGAVAVGESGAEYYEIFGPPRYDQLVGYHAPGPLRFV